MYVREALIAACRRAALQVQFKRRLLPLMIGGTPDHPYGRNVHVYLPA